MRDHMVCPSCGRPVEYERFHAGFGDQGFIYGSNDATVLTWSAYDPNYLALVDALPWILSAEQQHAVEAEIASDIPGAPFRFDNPPRCPHCQHALLELADDSRAYFVVTGHRIDGERTSIWRDRGGDG